MPKEKGSAERAKKSAIVVAGTGLSLLLPGVGSPLVRLGQHISELITASRLARLESFHQKVFKGGVTDAEINARFSSMEDEDFQHLLASMLTDIESEKVALYAAIYIHLIENTQNISKKMKRQWLFAASQLRLDDLRWLRALAEKGFTPPPDDGSQRLLLVGAVRRREGNMQGFEGSNEMYGVLVATEFGTDLVRLFVGVG